MAALDSILEEDGIMNIAFVGPQGSGKSTLAEMLTERRTNPYLTIPIADSIKEVAEAAYRTKERDFDKREFYPQRKLGLDVQVSGREILQEIGAKIRDMDSLFWVNAWLNRYERVRSLHRSRPVVVDDLRLPIEANFMREHVKEIVIVRVYASAEARTSRRGTLQGVSDITETAYMQTLADLQIDTTDLTADQSYAILKGYMTDNGHWQSTEEA
jgi:dephospho-CoA kinase